MFKIEISRIIKKKKQQLQIVITMTFAKKKKKTKDLKKFATKYKKSNALTRNE
jgi:hypothetical protein